MKVWLFRALSRVCLAAAFGAAGSALAQAPGGEAAIEEATQPPAPIVNRTVPPPVRPSLVAMLEPLWVDLTAVQQEALAPFAPEWNTWPMAEKKSWVALADKLPAMSGESRAKAQRRILEWANLSPEQRRVARSNYRLAKERPARQRVEEWQSYQSMTQEQREILRKAGSTSNTAAGRAGVATGLAREASQPLPRGAIPPAPPAPPLGGNAFVPATNPR